MGRLRTSDREVMRTFWCAHMTKMPQTPAPFWLYYFNVEESNTGTRIIREIQRAGATSPVLAQISTRLRKTGDFRGPAR
jgi:hypothetical protein